MSAATRELMRRRLFAVWALCLVGLAGGAVGASSSSALPARFWGVVPQESQTLEQLRRLRRGGVDSIRIPIAWGEAQPRRGDGFDWSGVDARLAATSRAGLEVLPVLYGAPGWAVRTVPVPGASDDAEAVGQLPVSGRAAGGWKRFVRAVVLRYGPRGSFWAENPTLPRRPLHTWQVWNEPNFKYFVARPNPAQYGRLVRLTYAAAHAADPGSRLVLAGLFARPAEASRGYRPPRAFFATDFLQRMYASSPGIRRKFIGVALHPYSAHWQELRPVIEAVRKVLARNHDGGKGLWITELGWSSERPSRRDVFAKGRRGQARELRGALSLLRHQQRRWRLRRVYWFSVDDLAGSCNFCGGSGLFGPGFRPKPAWHAFVAQTGGRVR